MKVKHLGVVAAALLAAQAQAIATNPVSPENVYLPIPPSAAEKSQMVASYDTNPDEYGWCPNKPMPYLLAHGVASCN